MKAVTKSLAMILAGLAWSNLAYTCEIHRAARQGHVEKVKEMLVADPGLAKQQCLDIGDFWLNGTPLHWASSSGQEEVVEYLLAHEVDVNAKAVNTLYTPLHSAAGFGRRDVAELLLASKAAVDSRDKDRNTPLHLAAGNWPTEVIELLLANRPKIYEKDKEGKMQLQVMQAWDARDVIELLLANRAEVNARNKLGRTPLHMAAEFGNKGVIELLLSHKADVDAKDKKGRTPLRIALDTQEKIGETELPLKRERLHALGEAIDLLRSRGAKE